MAAFLYRLDSFEDPGTEDPGTAGTFTQLTVGGSHTCGLRPNAYFQCWGSMAALDAPLA